MTNDKLLNQNVQMVKEIHVMLRHLIQQNSLLKQQLIKVQRSIQRIQVNQMQQNNKKVSQILDSYKDMQSEMIVMKILQNSERNQKIEKTVTKNEPQIFCESKLNNRMSRRLLQEIKKYNKNISHSQILFQYDNRHSINFYEVIYGVKNILLIVKLKNGSILVGYSTLPFERRLIPQQNNAFIGNLTNLQFYYPKNPYKTICYDPNNLIFGNSQIRIKSNENIVYCNFGINQGFYNTKDHSLEQFIGIKTNTKAIQREYQIDHYEIYKMI